MFDCVEIWYCGYEKEVVLDLTFQKIWLGMFINFQTKMKFNMILHAITAPVSFKPKINASTP